MYGLRENSVNEKHELCGVIAGHGHVCVIEGTRDRQRETGRESSWSLLYNAAEPVSVVYGRSHCDISGLTDVLIVKVKPVQIW